MLDLKMKHLQLESNKLLKEVILVAGVCNISNLRADKTDLKQSLKDIKQCLSMPNLWYLCRA